MKRLTLWLFLTVLPALHAFDWPGSDAELHARLRQISPHYEAMAATVEKRTSLRFETTGEVALGTVVSGQNGMVIQLNPSLARERRATILIWELANAYQRPRFDSIDHLAQTGVIKTPQEFGLRMEMIEYDSHRHHKDVLDQLARAGSFREKELLFFINDQLESVSQYAIPYAHDYLEAQAKSGHTGQYEKWFHRQKPQTP